MATLYIAEYPGFAEIGTERSSLPGEPRVTDQAIALGGASVASNAFNASTHLVLLIADTGCSIVFGAAPIATLVNLRIPANVPMLFPVIPGQKVATILNA